MPQSRRNRIRRWHSRRVFNPFAIRVEHKGMGFYFLRKLEARYSQSRQTWLWRIPAVETAIAAETTA